MSTREDVKTFFGLPLDFSMLELEPETDADLVRYFCTPENAEIIGWGSCGTHFVLLPGDEAVYCVEPELAEEGTFVLPVGADFREFVSHLLYCKCTSPLAQIFMLDATRFRKLLEDNAANTWPGCEEDFKSGDASLAAPERDEKLAVQAAAQATSPVVRTVAVGMDAGDYTETVTCDYTPVYVDDRFCGYCYVLGDAVWLPADAFAEMLGLESDTVTDGDTETVTVDGADITATYGATYYTANGRCFYAPDGVYALDGEVVLPLADLEKIFGVTAAFSADNTSLRVDASEQALLESGESYYGARDVYWLSHIINAEAGNQPMDGQIAVGNVVLNRVADERFPNSVKEVVFDRRGGVALCGNGNIHILLSGVMV